MLIKMIKSKVVIFLMLTLLFGCTIELRSPIKISKTKEEEKAPSPRQVQVARPSSVPIEQVRPKRESVATITPGSEQPTIIRKKTAEEPTRTPEVSQAVSASAYKTASSSPENIVILSSEYLTNTPHEILGKINVKDVSQNGFTKKEANQALKFEAFRQFGRQAKGITNVTYQGETSFFGSERYYEASGDVVTWPEKGPTYQQPEMARRSEEYEEAGTSKKQAVTQVPPIEVKPLERETALEEPSVAERSLEPTISEESVGTSSPANILILSEIDLIDYNFWILGKVTVQSKSKDGFSAEQANSALKVEAFRRYGGKARGIINVTYEKKKGLFNLRSDKYRGASGDVVTWKERKAAPRKVESLVETPVPETKESAVSLPSPSTKERSRVTPSPEPTTITKQPLTPKKILVLSPEELVNIPFKFLGRVKAVDDSGRGYDKKRAMNALKVEAYKAYGDQARGITNIDFRRKRGILNIEKFEEVYADVVTWEAEGGVPVPVTETAATATLAAPEPQTPTVSMPAKSEEELSTTLEEAEAAEEATTPPEYTTEITDPDKIMILKEDELLTPNYKRLGTVTIKAPTRFGLREFEADAALKKEALKQFGSNVRGIINVQYKKAEGLYSADTAVKVTSATGEAITW